MELHSNRITRVMLTCAALSLTGCGSVYATRLGAEDRPAAKDAYLYGKFSVGGADTVLTMGLVLECEDGDTHVIPFSAYYPLQVIKISPSACRWTEIVYTRAGDIVGRTPAPPGRRVEIGPGKAYYLGDFWGATTLSSSPSAGRSRRLDMKWSVERAEDRYERTTAEWNAIFSNFAAVPTEPRYLLSSADDRARDNQGPQTAESARPTRVPAQTGFQMALSTGYAFPLGSADGTTTQSDFVSGQVPLHLELGGKLWPQLFLGVYFGAGFGGAGGALSSTCASPGVSCSSWTLRGGLEGIVYILPGARFDPYIGYGFGIEATRVGARSQAATASLLAFGVDYARFTLGVDYRLNPIVGFGPFLSLSLGQYQDISAQGPSSSQMGELGDKAVHTWLTLGARVTLFP
jgi:hypothetical protein